MIQGSFEPGQPVTFSVRGIAVPQGSLRAFMTRGKNPKPILTSTARNLSAWRADIAQQSTAAMERREMLAGPISVNARFALPRPASRPKKYRFPDRRPDLDKLIRALLDGMTGIVFTDDCQVVNLIVTKRYGRDWIGVDVVVNKHEGSL